MAKNKLTIRDIAKLAKVSHTTVSRVLNNDPNVKSETRARISKLIDRLNYRPDARARNLRLQRSNLIGMVVPDIRNPFYAELARGAEDKAYQEGFNVIFCSTHKKNERMEDLIPLMLNVSVGGLIFASARLNEPLVENLLEKRFPLVLVSRKLKGENFNYVVFNNYKGAYQVTRHLIETGYTKIAIITGPTSVSTGLDRLRGYQAALEDFSLPLNNNYILINTFERTSGYEGTRKLMTLEEPPEAIFAGSDYIAMGVIDALEEHHLSIPEDVALVGFDDTEFASNQRIRLTTVSQGEYDMGNIGVSILIDCIDRKDTVYTHKVVLEPRLIIRESCGYYWKQRAAENRVAQLKYKR